MRALVLLLFCSTLQAATIDPRVAKFDTCGRFELFSVNGIMTDENGAIRNMARIKEVYGNAYQEHLITYVLAYNQTRGLKTDFLDSAKQVISGYAGATWDKWMQAVTFNIYNLGLSATASTEIAKKVTDLFGFTKPSPYQDQDLVDITNKVMVGTKPGGRRLLFCHSQGNLYCNLVYDRLILLGMASKTIGFVGLAVPYSSMRTGNVHTTSFNDVVIDAVRMATLNNVLSPTLSIPYAPTVDALGHKLVETYFANSAARTQINSNITAEFGTLKSQYGAVTFPYFPVTYANTLWYHCPGCMRWDGAAWVQIPDSYTYWTPAPYFQSQYIKVEPGTLSAAMTQAALNGAACYSLAVAGIKNAQASRPTGTSWVWFAMGYPNYYGCWDMISGNPATDYRLGAWWLYGGDLPPVWRVIHDVQTGSVRAEGGARCNI